ncbi:MAG: porin [Gallionella sp.]|nr:porin [Gallionella sp.]
MRGRFAVALSMCILSGASYASNWLQLQGNEAPDAPAIRTFGFIQPSYTFIDAKKASGLQGAAAVFNGQYSTLNLNWPELQQPHQFQVIRAGLGARGRLNDSINYFVALDAGQNGVNYYRDVTLTDASLTFSYIPGARIRAGLFKLPTSEEALLAVNVSYPYVYNSNAVLYMLVGLPVQATGAVNAGGASSAKLSSGFSGFRDWGVQVYDSFVQGQWEYSYAAMLSNGAPIESINDTDARKDLTLRLQTSYLLGGKGPNREDISAFVWRQNGSRLFGTEHFRMVREGVGIKYLQGDYRASAEYLRANGMVVGGQAPPFVGQPFAAGVNEKADGWYVEGGWRFLPQWEANLRYDYLDFMMQTAANEREMATTTLGLQYFINPVTRAVFNYEWRDMKVSNPAAIAAGAPRANALTLANGLGDRISVQLTWSF